MNWKNPTGNSYCTMNNSANYIIIIVGILIVCGCSKALPQTVDFPYYGFRNSDSQEIVRVERTDTATVFHMKSFYFPDMWIKVAKETYLTDGKRRYALLSAEGIVPGEKLVMGSDGHEDKASLVISSSWRQIRAKRGICCHEDKTEYRAPSS